MARTVGRGGGQESGFPHQCPHERITSDQKRQANVAVAFDREPTAGGLQHHSKAQNWSNLELLVFCRPLSILSHAY